jgi:hypothetical protein
MAFLAGVVLTSAVIAANRHTLYAWAWYAFDYTEDRR